MINDYNCITEKDTQPSQTCSEGYIFETGPEGHFSVAICHSGVSLYFGDY